jgi:hypothetical protein
VKLILEPADLLAMFGGGEATAEVRERIAGMLLSTVDSPEMKQAIEARITQPARDHLDRVIRDAVRETKQGWPQKDVIVGWGAQIIREAFQEQLQQSGTNLYNLIRSIVKEHFDKILSEGIEAAVKAEVKRIITEEMLEKYRAQITVVDINKLIKAELNRRLERLGSGI